MAPATSDVAAAAAAAAAAADSLPANLISAPKGVGATPLELSRQFEPRFIPSQDLMISCGCVLVDLTERRVAILNSTTDSLVQLPKGRKNMGEDILATALRETYEETGIPCKPLPLLVATRSTPAAAMLSALNGSDPESVTTSMLNCEPSSVCVYRCEYTLAFKLVFWFAAQADSATKPDESLKEPWEQDLKLEWVDAREASSRMTFPADSKVIEKVLSDMRNSGYDI
ncbi:hypothetical protein PT974_09270 [Cladobotryum mycophilum]|uniref:Nudix hydrolase domain-containing protein n=1 Tax=Cladobotryum mycophilum TaxID=491253 RepID=A0ABR0SGY9_9HYPO